MHEDPLVQAGRGCLARLPRHTNPGLEVVILLRGRLQWEVKGRPQTVAAGSVFFTLPWQHHGSTHDFEPGHEWVFVVVAAEGDARRGLRLAPVLGFTAAQSREIGAMLAAERCHAWPASPALRLAVLELADSPSGKAADPWARDRRIALARLAILELVLSRSGVAARATDIRFTRLLDRLDHESAKPCTLAEMAATCRLGRTRFAQLFTRETGDSPMVSLNRLRIGRARALLRGTRLTVTRIAHECGFSSSQYFATVFGRFTGECPAAYRSAQPAKSARKNDPTVWS